MRKVVAGLFISLDGVMEAPDTWTGPYFNSAYIVLLGAEVNHVIVIEEHAPGGKQEGELAPDSEAHDTTLRTKEHVSA